MLQMEGEQITERFTPTGRRPAACHVATRTPCISPMAPPPMCLWDPTERLRYGATLFRLAFCVVDHSGAKGQCEALDRPMVFLTFQGVNSSYGTTAPTCVMIQLLQLQRHSRIIACERRILWGYLPLVMPTGLLFTDMKTLHYRNHRQQNNR